MSFVPVVQVASDGLPRQPNTRLEHLPGPKGHWYFGNLRALLPDPAAFLSAMRARHGDCFTVGVLFNRRVVVLSGPAANRLVLLDPESNFSSRMGWEVVLDFFGGFLMLRDFEDHRLHRRLLTGLFKPDALRRYLASMQPIIRRTVASLDGEPDVYPLARRLALDIGLQVFADVKPEPGNEAVYLDTLRVLEGVMASRIPIPGTRRWRALRARDRLRARLLAEVSKRRNRPGKDMFSRLACFEDAEGRLLSDRDIVDHMMGMLFAAHETTASAMTMMMYSLARHRDWQQRVRAEVLTAARDDSPGIGQLADMPLADAVLRETLRLHSPIQLLPRRNVRAFDFLDNHVPANSQIFLSPQMCHRDPELFERPEMFRPDRFLAQGPESRTDPFSFIPFGKGSHMCLGMHFAMLAVKALFAQLLRVRDVSLAAKRAPVIRYLPTLRPAQRLPLRFEPLRADTACGNRSMNRRSASDSTG